MKEITVPIPSRLKNAAVNGHVAGAVDIYDDVLEKDQQTINSEVDQTLTQLSVIDSSPTEGSSNVVSSGGVYDALQEKQDTITTNAQIGMFVVQCTTASDVAAKVVTANNFVLVPMGLVSIWFTNAVNTNDSTLNINDTGAKPIQYMGNPLPAGLIRPYTRVVMFYSGSAYEIVSLGMDKVITPEDEWVDLGLPSGIRWAKCNLDVSKASKFTDNPEDFGSYFSWGNITGHNANNQHVLDPAYTFNFESYALTIGSTIQNTLAPQQDAARVLLGSPWRMPSRTNFRELLDNTIVTEETVNGVAGFLFTSKADANKSIFLPNAGFFKATGYANTTNYWSVSYNKESNYGYALLVDINNVLMVASRSLFWGFPIRPVQ